MKIAIIIAMEEEYKALNNIFPHKNIIEEFPYKVYKHQYKNLEIIVAISKIGKAACASCTTFIINKYDPAYIINMGSCGGLNNVSIGSIILSKNAGYTDVDVTAFNYKLGQLPEQPPYFTSSNTQVNFSKLIEYLKNNYSGNVVQGFIITNDSFISDINKVNQIKHIYSDTIALDMEAAAFAQICYLYKKDFLLIKKVSDMADNNATKSFKQEINNIDKNLSQLFIIIFQYLSI